MNTNEERLDVLACDIAARPRSAPAIADVLPAVRALDRSDGLLIVEFDPAVAATLAACVEAERLCCAGIGWELDRDPGLRLRISATPIQLDLLEKIFTGC